MLNFSHEIKRGLLFGRKVMTKLDSILESRDITLPAKVLLVKAMVFPVVVYECQNWTLKKVEHQRFLVLLTCSVEEDLRVPWTAKRSMLKDQSWVFIGRTDAEPETPILWPPDTKS